MPEFFKRPPSRHINTSEKLSGADNFIKFSQSSLVKKVNSGTLNNIKVNYNGLCDIICNYIVLEDLLGEATLPPPKAIATLACTAEAKNKYGDKITVRKLQGVEDTHILRVTNFFTLMMALFFSIYPCNLFSNAPFAATPYRCRTLADGSRRALVDKAMLSARLNDLDIDCYIKFFAFTKKGLMMQGHSMLIKKIDNYSYSFFDPNHGEYLHLNINELAEHINKSTAEHAANQMVFLKASDFINAYRIAKKQLEVEELPSPTLLSPS